MLSVEFQRGEVSGGEPLVSEDGGFHTVGVGNLDVSTVSVRRTWGVPLMVGAPVGGLFGRGATATVAALVRVSAVV